MNVLKLIVKMIKLIYTLDRSERFPRFIFKIHSFIFLFSFSSCQVVDSVSGIVNLCLFMKIVSIIHQNDNNS